MNTRNNQLARLHILLNKQGIDNETKREIYAAYGVTSSRDMTDHQLGHLIARLEGRNMGPAPAIPARQEVSAETRRLRSQCLKLITGSPDDPNQRARGLGVPNRWDVINTFILNHAGARLNQLSDGSLMAFVKKLRAIRDRDGGWRYHAKEATPAPVAPVLVISTTSKIVN